MAATEINVNLHPSCGAAPAASPRVLLSSVFGPFGVDDEFGRKENICELFHNQVTREQGLFSPRFHHQSFGLYLIAENIRAAATVLDFPSQRRFVQEIERRQYDYIGVSSILSNIHKARRMAQLVRRHAPRAKIVLGGHAAGLPEVRDLVDCDYVCRGEGIRFMRELLGEDAQRPIFHPVMPIAYRKYLMGIPLPSDGVVMMPGVGCPNGCRFCCTSDFFGGGYVPFLHTGREVFEFCVRAERERGAREFWIMDENFLKHRRRAEEFLAELERHDKFYGLYIFSSAEAIRAVGVDFLKRLGVVYLWLGLEGREPGYEKNRDVDLPALVRELRDAGIAVLGSVILFTDQHDRRTIHRDIDFAIECAPDFVQFMQLAPWPNTPLYRDYRAAGRLRTDIAYPEWHGQRWIWFHHPHFTPAEADETTRAAFRRVWDELGSAVLRMIDTTLNGCLAARGAAEPRLQLRHAHYAGVCRAYRPVLSVFRKRGHNQRERDYAAAVIARFDAAFGRPGPWLKILAAVARLLAAVEAARIRWWGNLRQPRTVVTRFPARAPAENPESPVQIPKR